MTIWYYALNGLVEPVSFSEEDVAELLQRRFASVGIYFFAELSTTEV